MEQIVQQIEAYKQEIAAFRPETAEELEQYRIKFLGTKGLVKALFGEMKSVPNDRKKEFGQILNAFKQLAEDRYEAFQGLKDQAGAALDLDLTLPGEPHRLVWASPSRKVPRSKTTGIISRR